VHATYLHLVILLLCKKPGSTGTVAADETFATSTK